MSKRENQFRLMSQIGGIPDKFIEEAEYNKAVEELPVVRAELQEK